MAKCPVCKRSVKGASFLCVTCPKEGTWMHPRCGGYEKNDVLAASEEEQQQFRCNNCKKVKSFSSCLHLKHLPPFYPLEILWNEYCYHHYLHPLSACLSRKWKIVVAMLIPSPVCFCISCLHIYLQKMS